MASMPAPALLDGSTHAKARRPRASACELTRSPFVVAGVGLGWVYRERDCDERGRESSPSVVTIGQFDGVHRGHQRLLENVADVALEGGHVAGAVTFERHPMSVVRPDRVPRFITGVDQKVRLLLGHGARFVVVLTPTPHLMRLDPDAFVTSVLVENLEVRGVVVGADFRFGHRAAGDVTSLRTHGARSGFEVHVPSWVVNDDGVISSSAVRQAIAAGAMGEAAAMLGRPHDVRGLVVTDGRRPAIEIPRNAAVPLSGYHDGVVSCEDAALDVRVRGLPAVPGRIELDMGPHSSRNTIWRRGRDVVLSFTASRLPR